MSLVGLGLALPLLAIYFLFFTESGWLRTVGGVYLGFFFVASVIYAFQSTEPLPHLITTGLIALLVYFAYSISRKWKDWP